MFVNSGKYRIELKREESFSGHSTDNFTSYQKAHFEQSKFECTTQIGLYIFENGVLISSAIIGSYGGGSGIHKNSQVVEHNRIVVCCSDSIFCLCIPDLSLIWKAKADGITCFEIFKRHQSYIIHGELEISRLDLDGRIMWQRSGADIFTTPEGKDDFEVTQEYIRATDWENRTYKFDFNGFLIE